MQYLTYDEYIKMGGRLVLTAFNRNIDRACAYVDSLTLCRMRKVSEIPRAVKACLRDLVEYLDKNSSFEKAISSKSQSVGGVSESESYKEKTNDDINNEMFSMVYDYLSTVFDDDGVPLMYRGASNAFCRQSR